MLTLKLAAPARPTFFSRLKNRFSAFEKKLYSKSESTRLLLSLIAMNCAWSVTRCAELAEAGETNLVLFAPHVLMFVLNAKLAQWAFRLN